jgi:hypothetical protein
MSRFCADDPRPDHGLRAPLNSLVALAVWLGLVTACTAPAQTVTNGELFDGPLISVRAPLTGKWSLTRRSDAAITFGSSEAGNTFVAEVTTFRLAAAATPKEFEALVRTSGAPDLGFDPSFPDRYEVLEESVKPSSDRPYPCVRYRSLTKDNRAKGTDPQFFEMAGLYCRHPQHPAGGIAVKYSHRGLARHALLRDEAERFIQGAQLVAK